MCQDQKDSLKLSETNFVPLQLAGVYCCIALIMLEEVLTVMLPPLFNSFHVGWSNCQVPMVFWTVPPLPEYSLITSSQLKGLGVADKLGSLEVHLGFAIGL